MSSDLQDIPYQSVLSALFLTSLLGRLQAPPVISSVPDIIPPQTTYEGVEAQGLMK